MDIIHSFNKKKVVEHSSGEVSFLITNKQGNHLALGPKNFTHMQGLFFFDHEAWELYKTLDDIKLHKQMNGIRNNFFNVQRLYKEGARESFNLFNDSIIYSVKNYSGELILELDFREMFDYDDKGRVYSVTGENGDIVIRYDKFSDDSLSVLDKTRFMVIKGAREFRPIGKWVKRNYSYDARRGLKSEFYIHQALGIHVNKKIDLVFAFSDSKEEAKAHAQKIYTDRTYLAGSYKKYVNHAFTSRNLVFNIAMKALDDLLVSLDAKERSVGIFAGMPWFYQLWARDELISLKALMMQEKYYLVKSILFKYLHTISDDGLVPNKLPNIPGDRKSIDAVGWLFVRLNDFINLLVLKGILNDYFSVSDLIRIKQSLEKAIQGLAHHHSQDGLVVNNEQETWMDTKPAKRGRKCIEVQALFLAMINLHNRIAGITKSKQIFKSLEKETKERVKKAFFSQGRLYDYVGEGNTSDNALGNTWLRPNVFLAYYIYPGLLTRKEWKKVFDSALKELWLDWGGLASISHNSNLFKSEYTGQDDLSYHNGDSWYYINNYAAIAMHRLDKRYYAKYIKRILEASKEEMFFSGFIGCCAEVSSAKHMRSEGCLSQAWSAASFIELLHARHSHT